MQVNMELSLIYCNKHFELPTLDGFNQQAKCFCSLNGLTADFIKVPASFI